MKNYLKRTTTFILAILMLVSVPLQTLAEVGQGGQETPKVEKKINYDENPISDSGFKEGYINNKDIDVKVAKPKDGSQKFIEGPDIPDIYTMKAEYKIQRGDNQINNYQPYEASVGAGIKDEDKAKIKQTIKLPDFDGYTTPTPEFDVTHDSIVNKSKEGKKIEKKEGTKTWTEHKGFLPYIYIGKKNTLKVKHVFQSLEDQNKYGPMDGQTKPIETIETGLTGSIVTIIPLESDKIKGYKPETNVIETQMPEHTKNYVVEYRYNRKHFDVHYDTKGGSPIATRTIYYGQRIPTIPLLDKKGKITTDTSAEPTHKVGSIFQGWKPSIELKTKDGKEFEKDEIIKDSNGNPIKNLDAKFIMPADNVTFTAVWKDKEKADYAVQFWAEKADHADNAGLEKYDYIGTHVYKNEPTGKRPDLDKEPVKDIVFPDLDKSRLQKIWNGEKFNDGHDLYLNKFYVYNQDLTHEQNKDPKNVNLVKSVDSTGETVYNIYYDRQVYNLYFTKSNVAGSAFYPEISKDGKEVGKEGNPYHFKARFNQSMVGLWPDDVKEVRGFTEGKYSLGWLPNLKKPEYFYRDTPPYRLSANLFIDFPQLIDQDGYASEIDLGNGKTKPASITDLSFGIDQSEQTMPHQIDFWLDGFDGEPVIDYDLYTIKSDTNNSNYHDFLPPDLQGFTPKNSGGRGSEFKDSYDLDDLNEEREEITAPKHVNIIHNPESDEDEKDYKGKLKFMKNFPGDDKEFDKNGYLKFEYSRNKYPLRFNYDPTIIRDDSYFKSTNSLDTFYEFPLKALSPDADTEESYKTGNPKNILDNPEKLKELGLTDLVFTDPKDGKLKVKRPEGLSEDMVFKGWALDPAGTKLIRDNGSEKMPSHPVNLYAKWGEPNSKWKVTIDPNGGYLSSVKAKDLTKTTKTIQEGDIGQEEEKTYPIKEKNDGKKQIFTVVQRQQLNKLEEPQRLGYDFLGWEWVKFNEDGTENKTYSKEYKVPELYSFGNDIVSNVYLKAIWVKNDLQIVMAYHHILDKDLKEVPGSPESQELPKRRKGYFAAVLGSKQGSEYTLVPNTQWEDLKQKNTKFKDYYDEKTGRTNNYFQVHEIKGPLEVEENGTKEEKNNPENDFHFFYMPYRKREYKVNYLDERCKADVEKFMAEAKDKFKKNYEAIKNDSNKTEDQKREAYRNLIKVNEEYFEKIVSKYSIIAPETVINGKRHYDARNYRHIPGWTLAENESPQQQLFFDVDESTNEFLGINGTGLGEVFFFYQDARVIEVKNPEDKVPDGYVRVTFKADKGGSFGKDAKGDDIKVLYYDVIKGLKSDSLPVPQKWEGLDNLKDKDKNYITPDYGKNFVKWDNKPLLNKGTILQTADNNFYVFTAYFDWSGLSTSSTSLVRTEAFKDPNKQWTNDFAPKIEDLKKQLVWKEKDKVKPIPAGTKIEFVYKDDAGKETKINTDEDVFNLVKEMGKEDKDEVVRVVNIVAKVTFEEGKKAQELTIPITVYKNVYEALNKEGDKPLFLTEAEGKEAKDGGLKDVSGNYVKVTVQPTNKPSNKDAKIYYVNPKAWVEISKVDISKDAPNLGFTKWTADKDAQNENGKFDFTKRHKFNEDTVITPGFTNEVVEQEDPNKKPPVPDSYVKVIVKTTDKATTAFEKTFWVNPEKEVTIPVDNPVGKTVDKTATEAAKAYTFKDWKSNETTSRTWTSGIKGKFTKATTIIAEYTEVQNIIPYDPVKDPTTRPDGYVRVTFVAEKGLNLENVIHYYVKKNAGIKLNDTKLVKPKVKAETGYEFVKWDPEDTTEIKDTDVVVKAKARELDSFIPADGNKKPDGYVTVTFVAGDNGSLDGVQKYYVNPTKYIAFNPPNAIGETGYEFASWSQNSAQNTNYTKDTTITATFNQIGEVSLVEKPGYVKVDFVIKGKGGSILTGQTATYYVDPNRKVTLNAPVTSADVGYEFASWSQDPAAEKKYAQATIIEGTFNKLDDIIPATDDQGKENAKPEGYVTLTFEKGNGGKTITGKTIYYVNPKANSAKTLADITKPKVSPDTGYTFDKWDTENSFQIKADKTVTATYKELPLVSDAQLPGYVKVTFDTTSKGHIEGTSKTEKIVYVNPKKPVVLKSHEPKITPTTNNVFARWDVNLTKETFFKDGDRITAQYYDKTIISVTQVKDFVKVVFDKGDNGDLTGTQTYWVKPGVDVTVPAPTVNPNTGYEFNNWDHPLTVNLPANSTDYKIKAEYKALEDIIECDKTRPNGYVKVEFVSYGNGKLIGNRSYYVKPNKNVDLTSKADAIFKNPNVGFTEKNGNWSNDNNKNLNDTFSADAIFKYNFKELKGVDTTNHPGYVKVEFIAGENGQIVGGNKTYYVNPNKKITVGSNELAIPDTNPNKNYEFDKWFTEIDQTNPVTRDRTYIAQFKLSKVTLTYVADDKTSGTVPKELSYDIGTEITLAGRNDLKKDNYSLTGWKIGDKTYKPGEKFTINENTTATAVWETDYHNVDFNTDGGTYIEPKKIKHNETIGAVTNPEKVNYTFTGWQVDGQDFNPTTSKVTKDITLVAQYVSDVVEQTDPNTKPQVPNNFVKVIVKSTDMAENVFEKTFWVNPEKEVTIPVNNPKGKVVKKVNGDVDYTWQFKEWDKKLTQKFTATETIITANYQKLFDLPEARGGFIYTDLGKQITEDQYKKEITLPKGYSFATGTTLEMDKKTAPNVNESGRYYVEFWVNYPDGKGQMVEVLVYVGEARPEPKPYPSYPGGPVPIYPEVRRETIIQEKIVKVPVPVSDNYFKEVRYMQGFNGYFRPNDGLTRAEAAQILANALVEDGYKYNPNFKISYKDVGEAWYTRAVKIVTEANVFAGYDDGNFKPQAKITRNEWIATLKRFQELGDASGNNMKLSDNHWAKSEIQAAFNEGWLKIYTDGLATYKGDEFIPRQEVAAVSNKAFKRMVDKTYIGKNNLSLVTYKDVNTSMWAYEDILCASNTFLDKKDLYRAHWVKEDKNQFNIDTSDLKIVQKNFQRNPR